MRKSRFTLRQSMDYLHTWAGLLFSGLLFLVFFMGTLSVFDHEIDRWMLPQTRIEAPAAFSFDREIRPHLEQLAPKARQWFVGYPNERSPMVRIGWREGDRFVSRQIDPSSGVLLPEAGSWGGTGFFFPLHYSFHLKWMDIGYWLLAIVSIAMLALIVSGVIVHKKIFTDFFSFRPDKSRQRMTLDLHNIAGVVILPFHFLITFSGLVIFFMTYFKPAVPLLFGPDMPKVAQEAFGQVSRPPLKVPAALTAIDPLVADARERWGGGNVRNLTIVNPGDRNAVVQVLRRPDDRVGYETLTVNYDGSDGTFIGQQKLTAVSTIQRFFSGLHMIPLSQWGIRWLYFLMGLGGCLLIVTGQLLWAQKRAARHLREGRCGYRLVDAVTCASSLGLLVASAAMLVANRLLPDLPQRALMEAQLFFGVWFVMLLHALWRSGSPRMARCWLEQAWLLASLTLGAALLNWLTTGDHLPRSIARGDWVIAAIDLLLIGIAAISAGMAYRYIQRGAPSQAADADRLQESAT